MIKKYAAISRYMILSLYKHSLHKPNTKYVQIADKRWLINRLWTLIECHSKGIWGSFGQILEHFQYILLFSLDTVVQHRIIFISIYHIVVIKVSHPKLEHGLAVP